MESLFYIRHAPTQANLVGDIVKDYDSYSIVDFDIEKWKKEIGSHIPNNFKLFVSPAKRCKETAEKLFPGKEYEVLDELKEFDVSGLGSLKFWEITEEQFNKLVNLTKYQTFCRIRTALKHISKNVDYHAEAAVIIGHGFYGRLLKDAYDGKTLDSSTTVLGILNSKYFQFRNLDMMEIENANIKKVYRFKNE